MLAVAMVVAFAFATTTFAYTHTVTLKVGSSGAQVMALQQALGITADGSFGPMTKAAVMSFQAKNGLTADGVVGAMTGAKLAGGSTGCTGFDPMTGKPCGSSTVPGCMAGYMFSSTTGAKCDGSSTGSTGSLSGGAGDITVTELSSPSSSTKVGEGEKATKVLGFEVEADDGSDIALSSVRLSLEKTSGSGNDKLNRYATKVSVWMGSEKVGSADVSDFSENSGVYTKSVTLSNAVVRAGKIEKFYVAVDALSDIDSGNTGSSNNTWTVTLTSTRFTDATGVVLTDSTGSISNTAVFDTLSNTGDVELKVNLSSSTPTSKTVKVSTTSDTNQVELLKFTMKAQNSDMFVDQIPVSFASTNVTSGGLASITSNVTLVIDGQTFNESVTSSASSATISFNDLGLDINANDTVTGTVYADVADIESGSFDEGTNLSASLTSTLVATTGSSAGALDVEDSNGDQLVTGDRSGSAVGNTITFRSTGVNTVMGTPTYERTTDTNGLVTSVTYTIPVAVTSFGNTLYMGQSAQLATAATASNAFALVLETAAAPNTESVSAATSITLSTTDATVESNGYRLDDGVTKHFSVKVTMTAATDNTSIRFRLDTIRTSTTAALVSSTNSDLLPVTDYRTDFQYINN